MVYEDYDRLSLFSFLFFLLFKKSKILYLKENRKKKEGPSVLICLLYVDWLGKSRVTDVSNGRWILSLSMVVLDGDKTGVDKFWPVNKL